MEPQPQPLDPAAVALWRLQRLTRLATVGLVFAAGLAAGLSWLTSPTFGLLIGGGLLFVQALLAVIWPPLQYQRFRYTLRDQDLLVEQGVLFRSWTSVPYNRIQHADTRQGPLERLFGLSRLLVFTASGPLPDGSIPALAEARATELRDLLSRRGGDDGV